MSKLSGVSRLVDSGLPGVAMEIASGWGDFLGGPRVPRRLTADGGSGISCCIRLALNSPSGNGGGAEGFGIGGADGGGLVNPSRLICGDTTTEPDFGVGGILLEDELDDELGVIGRPGAGGLKNAGASKSNPG